MSAAICNIDVCRRLVFAGGYCGAHYARKARGADMDTPVQVKKRPRRVDWRGSAPCGVEGAHSRVRSLWGPAGQYPCMECDGAASDWAYDGADPDQLYGPGKTGSKVFYSRYPEFYMPMCKKCHCRRDGERAQRELEEYRTLKHQFGLTYDQIVASVAPQPALRVAR